jgi:hypothetical protein
MGKAAGASSAKKLAPKGRDIKFERTVGSLPSEKWIALDEAAPQLIKASGGSSEFAAHDLTRDLRDGDQTMGARWLVRGVESCFVFKPEFWRQHAQIDRLASAPTRLRVLAPNMLLAESGVPALRAGRWLFFLDRTKFNERVKPLSEPALIKAADDAPSLPSKRGRKTKFSWDRITAEVLHRCYKDGFPDDMPKFIQELYDWCGENLDAVPEFDVFRKRIGVWFSQIPRPR